MADVPRKPTPAQKRRLEQIGRGQITRHGPSWIYGSYHSTGTATGGITYNMMCGLHDAGWIADEPHGQYYKLILTEAGRGALGVAVVDEREQFEAAMGEELKVSQGQYALSRAHMTGRPYTFLATIWAWEAWQRARGVAGTLKDAPTPAVAALEEIRQLTRKLLDEPEKWNASAVLTRIFGLTVDGVGACDKAPAGWWCSRPAGHAGPCAAYPTGGTVDQSPRDPRDEEEQRAARTEGR